MKNMKLTHLSLSVLIALGLVACGGSDNKDDMTIDKDKHGETGGKGGTGPKGPKTDPKDGLEIAPRDPARAIPGLTVEPNLKSTVEVRKQLYIDRQSRDAVAGYNGWFNKIKKDFEVNVNTSTTQAIPAGDWTAAAITGKGPKLGTPPAAVDLGTGGAMVPVYNVQGDLAYNIGATDKEDILRASSIYNYFEHQSKEKSLNANGGIHANPSYSYALGNDGMYYRVKPAGSAKWDTLNSSSKFELVNADFAVPSGYGNKHSNGTKIPMKDIYFIPNALSTTEDGSGANKGHKPDLTAEFQKASGVNPTTFGINVVNPDSVAYFDITRGDVKYKSFEIVGAGKEYKLVEDFDTRNLPLDLSSVKPAYKIQKFPIEVNYTVTNNQATGSLADDEVINNTAKVGEVKVYDLPYSRSLITVNQQAVKDASDPNAAPNNLFGLNNSDLNGNYGAFQVVGFQTPALPRDGRADYVGKSYGVDTVGDIQLTADFAINRATISGIVKNRVNSKGTELAPLKLENIQLSDGTQYENTASHGMLSTAKAVDGDVSVGGRSGQGKWAVALYGPNAEEAAGVIDLNPREVRERGKVVDLVIDGVSNADNGKKFEVFSTQRKTLIKDSLNPGVGVAK